MRGVREPVRTRRLPDPIDPTVCHGCRLDDLPLAQCPRSVPGLMRCFYCQELADLTWALPPPDPGVYTWH